MLAPLRVQARMRPFRRAARALSSPKTKFGARSRFWDQLSLALAYKNMGQWDTWPTLAGPGRPFGDPGKDPEMSSTVASSEAEVLADAVRYLNAEAIEFVEGCSPTAWTAVTAEEGWALPMAGTHIAIGHLVIARWVHRVASGQDVNEKTADFEVSNALDARNYSDSTQAQVVERLRVYGAALERLVRDLSDEQLKRSGTCVGQQRTAAEVVRDIAVGHARGHLSHMVSAARATENAPTTT